jgi:hypothetical protein
MATFLDHGKKYNFDQLCALYAHPQSGDLQTLQEWIDDSAGWHGDIAAQLATLIEADDE